MEGGSWQHVECAICSAVREHIAIAIAIESDLIRTVVRDGQVARERNVRGDNLGRSKQLVARGGVEVREHDSGDNRHQGNDHKQLDEREGSVTSSSTAHANRRAAADSALGAAS